MRLQEKSDRKNSYGQILRASSIMGGAGGISMLMGMAKIKFAALLIGTGGVGLLANFTAIQAMVGSIAGLGLASSAVRDVVTASAKSDEQAIGRTVLTLRRMCWLTGMVGMLAMILLSPLLSELTFGSRAYTLEIASLGLIILFGNLSGGQTALIQGIRRIDDIARLGIIGATAGTILSIAFYLWLGLRGIVPALVLTSAVQLVVTWHYAQRVPVPRVVMTWRESFREADAMLRLGIAMMWTALISSVAAYITNTMITQQINVQAVGIYSAAFTLSSMFINFVTYAMGADYYPRLTAVAHDKEAMNRLVSEQTEISLLLGVPGLLATLSLAPWIIRLLYTNDFLPATNLLQWFILGCLIRLVQWPMGFLQLALGKSTVWFSTQTSFVLLHLVFIWFGLMTFGLEGVSIAFLALHGVSLVIIILVAKRLTGFRWGASTRRLFIILLPIIALTFLISRQLPLWFTTLFGIVATAVTSLLCLRGLVKRVGLEHSLTRMAFKIPGIRRVCGH